MNNILFVTEYFLRGSAPRVIRSANIIKYLENYRAEVLCLDIKGPRGTFFGTIHVVQPHPWHRQKLHPPEGRLTRLLHYIWQKALALILFPDLRILESRKLAAEIFRLDMRNDYEAIVLSVVPFSLMSVLSYLPEKVRGKIIIDIGDPLYMNVVKIAPLYPDSIRKRFEGRHLKLAARIIVTNQATAGHFNKTYGIPQERIKVIPQGFDEDLFKPRGHQKQTKDPLKIAYAGTFYPGLRDSIFLTQALSDINIGKTLVDLTVYGGRIKTQTDHIHIVPGMPQDALVDKLHEADLMLFVDNAYGLQTSGKIYELLSLEKPLLFLYSDPMSPLMKEMQGRGKNIVFCFNEKEAIVRCLADLLSQNELPVPEYPIAEHSWRASAKNLETMVGLIKPRSMRP